MHDDINPTPLGLLRCLQVLTEEAAYLGLTRTLGALQDAVEACRAEGALARKQTGLPGDRPLLH